MKKTKVTLVSLLVMVSILWAVPKYAHAYPVGTGTNQRCQDNPSHDGWWDWFWDCNYALPA